MTYKYDLLGNTACVTDKTGNNTVYTYDNLGLLMQRKVTQTGDSISYAYDEAGNRISMEDESGTSTYTYDENDRLLKILKGNTTQISYDYDQVGNVTSVTDLKGNAVAYTYDKASRMETVSNTGKTTTYTYDENGRRKSITYDGGVSEQYTYDKDNQLTQLQNKKPNDSIVSEYSYTYDLAGRQLSKTDSYGTTSYEYDKAGRINKVTAPGKTTVYGYDKAGNRISLNETYTSLQPSEYVDEATGKDIQYILRKSDYTYSNSNTLLKLVERMFDENSKELARKTTKYIYDDNGNQLRQSVSHTLPDNTKLRPATTGTAYGDNITGGIDKLVEKTSYTYDGFNRLRKTETVKDSVRTTAEYIYNGDDLRVSKTVKKSNNGYTAEVTNYLYDRQNVILETDASNNVKARYIKGINYIVKIDAANKESYFLFNGHGDVVQTVDKTGEVQNHYDYDIWGNPTLTVETSSNAIRYSGEFMDSETGLYYLRARYYDPYIGRFTTEDSYWGEDENPLSLNLYTYCENDPIRYTDPSGHMSANELDFYFGAGASQLYDENGNYKDDTVAMMIPMIGVITDVACSEANGKKNEGWSIMLPGDTVYGQIDNWSNIDVINTSAGRNTTITNHEGYHIGNLNTGDYSNTTINNRSIIETINTGKDSSLVLNNYGDIEKDINIDENGTGEINNYKDSHIGRITGGAITDGTKKGIYIENRGTIDYVLTGSNSHNVIDNEGGKLTLETGEGNESIIISGQKGVSILDGNGKAVYRLYSPEGGHEDVDVKNIEKIQVLIASGFSFDLIGNITNDRKYITNSKDLEIVESLGYLYAKYYTDPIIRDALHYEAQKIRNMYYKNTDDYKYHVSKEERDKIVAIEISTLSADEAAWMNGEIDNMIGFYLPYSTIPKAIVSGLQAKYSMEREYRTVIEGDIVIAIETTKRDYPDTRDYKSNEEVKHDKDYFCTDYEYTKYGYNYETGTTNFITRSHIFGYRGAYVYTDGLEYYEYGKVGL
jgi:RHS repeat-associated protein